MKEFRAAQREPDPVFETMMVWSRRGGKVSRKFSCALGPRRSGAVAQKGRSAVAVDFRKRRTGEE